MMMAFSRSERVGWGHDEGDQLASQEWTRIWRPVQSNWKYK